MTFKDCIHYEACKDMYYPMSTYDEEAKLFDESNSCDGYPFYSDKSKFIELPCKLGTKVYRVLYLNTPDDDYYMSFSKEWVIRQGNFNLSDLFDFGKTVFLTEKDAQLALQELKNKN